MGFFSNLKNKITGGGAKVSLQFEQPSLHNPFNVKVTALVSSNDLKIEKVYLYIRGIEKTSVRNVEVYEKDMSGDMRLVRKDINGEFEVFPKSEIVVAGAQTLNAGQTYEWTASVNIPGGTKPTYKGVTAFHEWQFLAGLDAPGNDPDSGWITVDLY
jgi:hypothetical protein